MISNRFDREHPRQCGPKTTRERLKIQTQQYQREYNDQQRMEAPEIAVLSRDWIQAQADYIKELERVLHAMRIAMVERGCPIPEEGKG